MLVQKDQTQLEELSLGPVNEDLPYRKELSVFW